MEDEHGGCCRRYVQPCDASTFALLAYGRFTVEEAVAGAEDITVEGNRELAMQFLGERPHPNPPADSER